MGCVVKQELKVYKNGYAQDMSVAHYKCNLQFIAEVSVEERKKVSQTG